MKPLTGILSGVGAFAGLRLMQYALDQALAAGATKDEDFPHIMLYNLPARGADKTGVADPDAFVRDVKDGLVALAQAGCFRMFIACNSAHAHFYEFQQVLMNEDRLLNMVDIACDAVLPARTVGVLCSASTRKRGIYSDPLSSRRVGALFPDEDEQKIIDAAIGAAMVQKHDHHHAERLQEITEGLISAGAERIIIGCTELPLVMDASTMQLFPCVDAGQEAVKKLLSFE